MEIKSEEIDISEDERASYDIIYRNNPVVATDEIIECINGIETNSTKIYTPLAPVGFDRFKSSRRLSTPLIKYSTAHVANNCLRSNGYKSLSPRKLGAKTIGRSYHDKLRSPKKLQNVDVNQKSQTVVSDETIVNNVDNIEYSQSTVPDPNFLMPPNNNEKGYHDESIEDIFVSQELDNRDRVVDHVNKENNAEQSTPLRVTREKLKNSTIDVEKLFVTPQSVEKRSISSDSEFERVCDSIKHNNFDLGHFSFETMDLLNGFDNLDDVESDRIFTDMLRLSVDNCENKEAPLTDPLAVTPQKTNHLEQSNENSSSKKRTRKRKILNENRRRSTRLQELSNNKPTEDDSSSTDEELRNVREKIKQFEESEGISPEIMERLKDLDIQLECEPLPQHQLENYISRPPTLDIKKAFVQYGPMKKGLYSKSEDKIIKENWKRFCEIHDWDPHNVKPFMNVRVRRKTIISNEQRIKFVQFLAQGLPWRLLYSVYLHFQLLYSRKKHEQKFTPEEDAQILVYMEKETRYSQKCLQLSQLLKRTKGSIWERYNILRNRKEKCKRKVQVEWDVPLIEKFLKNLLDVTLSKNIYDLKDAVIPKVVWVKLEKKLKIPHDTMMIFWLRQLHAQLFCTRPIYDVDIKIMLIEYLYVKGISNKREIIWSSVAKHFDGLTPHYLSLQFYSLVKCTPLKRQKNLAGVIGWLYEKRIPQLATKIMDKCLPRLIYENGKIEIIKDFPSSSSSSSSLESSQSD